MIADNIKWTTVNNSVMHAELLSVLKFCTYLSNKITIEDFYLHNLYFIKIVELIP